MPPIVALIICSTFVAFLLSRDPGPLRKTTRAIWIPTVWMLYTGSKPLGVWFSSNWGTPGTSPLDRIFLVLLIVAAGIVLSRRRFDWASEFRRNFWVTILLTAMFVSILWSIIPGTSFVRWIREVQALLMAFVVLSEPHPREAIESVFRKTIYILIPFSALLVKYFPAYGVEYGRWSGSQMWIGVTQQKNGLGRLCIIAALFLLWSLVRRRQGRNPAAWRHQSLMEIVLLALSFWLMGGPEGSIFYSATGTYAFIAGLAVYFGLYLARKTGLRLRAGLFPALISVIIVFGIIAFFSGGSYLSSAALAAGRSVTLTDRTIAWAQLLPVALNRPLLGFGFGGFWTPGARILYNISEAHSGYLDVALGLGVLGILLFSAILISSARRAYRILSYDYDWGSLWLCYLVMAAIHNIAESSLDSLTSHLTAILLFLYVISSGEAAGRNS